MWNSYFLNCILITFLMVILKFKLSNFIIHIQWYKNNLKIKTLDHNHIYQEEVQLFQYFLRLHILSSFFHNFLYDAGYSECTIFWTLLQKNRVSLSYVISVKITPMKVTPSYHGSGTIFYWNSFLMSIISRFK